MEKKGLILRQSVSSDARLKSLIPTERAAILDAKVREHLLATERRLTQGLSDQQLTLFMETASQMARNLDG